MAAARRARLSKGRGGGIALRAAASSCSPQPPISEKPSPAELLHRRRGEEGGAGGGGDSGGGRGVSFRGDAKWMGLAKAWRQDLLAGVTATGHLYVAELTP